MNDPFFDLPDIDAARVEARQGGLPPAIRALVERASDALIAGRPDVARHAVVAAIAQAPMLPDVLRMAALVDAARGEHAAAGRNFELALRLGGDDALVYRQYAESLEDSGAIGAAGQLRQRAVQRLQGSPLAAFDLGEHLFRHGSMDAAIAELQRAVALAPEFAPALLKLGSALVYAGRIDEGAAAYRRVLAAHPHFGAAWFSLANIKTLPFTAAEVARMERLLAGSTLQDPDRMLVQFALAKAREDEGAFADAFALLADANGRKRAQVGWSAERFREDVRRSDEIFAGPHAAVEDPEFGNAVIFVVGLPRSGTTLTEQIIASHSCVDGASELPDVSRVLAEESARRQQPYPAWVGAATPADWRRLGQRYLDLTAHWHPTRPRFTDKMPSNWLFIGAIRCMLPGARIVVCRRDPLENCWSCYKQYFFAGWDFTFDLGDLAAYWQEFDRSVFNWVRRDPRRVREQRYEALTENPELEVRGLLDFCGLPFEDACLQSHKTTRSVRTASAGQVRQPITRSVPRATAYGELLDPLRMALGLTPIAGGKDTSAQSFDQPGQ